MASPENIKLLQKQVAVSDIEAKRLLIKHNNNIVNCVLDSYGIYKEEPSKSINKNNINLPNYNINQINSKNVIVI